MKSFKESVRLLKLIFIVGFLIAAILLSIYYPSQRPTRIGVVPSLIVLTILYYLKKDKLFDLFFNISFIVVIGMVIFCSGLLNSLGPVVGSYIFLIFCPIMIIFITYSIIICFKDQEEYALNSSWEEY